MSQVWIDLTDLASWRGHFTGIQRVVYSYASRFAEDGASFFLYDHIDDRHVEIDFGFLERVQASESTELLSRRQKIKRTLTKPYHALSPSQKQALKPIVRASNHLIRSTIHATIDRRKIPSPYKEYPSANFACDDRVVLLGAGWNNPGSLRRLCEIRDEKHIFLVQHINDILPIYQPHLFADELPKLFAPYTKRALLNADVITVISEATKRDLLIFCQQQEIKPPTIVVIRLGEDVASQESSKPKQMVPKNFILSVGTFEIRKNYMLLYQAAKLAELEGKDFPDIVIAGRKGWLSDDLAHVIQRDPYATQKIHWMSNLSDAEISWLHTHCMFTIFPSLCEGWGLPIVESLQHGKVCITSNVSSMLEIGNGLVDYFSPYDARSCLDQITNYLQRHDEANQKVQDEYVVYSWDESYRSYKAAVESSN